MNVIQEDFKQTTGASLFLISPASQILLQSSYNRLTSQSRGQMDHRKKKGPAIGADVLSQH